MEKTVTKTGILGQLESMLTNHPERKAWKLRVQLKNSSGEVIDENDFLIYTNNPENKIYEKVRKLKLKGGYPTLNITKFCLLGDNDKCNVFLCLSL